MEVECIWGQWSGSSLWRWSVFGDSGVEVVCGGGVEVAFELL